MSDINNVVISGNLVRDPISRGDGKVAAFTVASNRSYKQGDDWIEEACFVDVTAFNGNAKRVLTKLSKGQRVTVLGRLELNRWEAEDGTNRSQIRIVANTLESEAFFVKGETAATEAQESLDTEPAGEPVGVASGTEDDIPF